MNDNDPNSFTSIPLTSMQAWMVFQSNAVHRPWINLEQVVVHVDDQVITAEAMAEAWTMAAATHPSLRASVMWRKRKRPRLHVVDETQVIFHALDWRDVPEADQPVRLEGFLAEDRDCGVALKAGLPWRVTLIRLGPDRSVLVWTIHHALTDGRSMAIVLEDVFSILDTGAPVSAPQSVESHLFLSQAEGHPPEGAEAFFAGYLRGFDPPDLTADVVQGSEAQRRRLLTHVLDAEVTDRLRRLADRCGGTLNNIVQAAWGLVLARWYNADDIVFGVVRSGRHGVPAPERATGCFINALPMRLKLGADTTLQSLVGGLRRDTLAMHPFERVSAAEIRRMCALHGTAPLFDTVVMFERGSLDTLVRGRDPHWANRRVELREESDMPISLSAYADPAMRLDLQFDPEVLPGDRADRLLDHLGRLMASMAEATPDTPLGDLASLGDAERAEVLALGRPDVGPAEYGDPVSRFRAIASEVPDAVAVQPAGAAGGLGYRALDRKSNALAGVLAAEGAAPGEIVAIHLGRSTDYIVSLLAVLKTGAAFLPVDPSYPAAVKAHMLTDSGARLVISDDAELEGATGAVVSPRVADAAPGTTFEPVPRDPADPAYVIYTSGSTGTPKGVVIPNRAMAAHAAMAIRILELGREDRVGQFASLSFDFSLEEIVPTLLAGATLVLRSDHAAGSAADFLDEVREQALTVVNLPTSFFHVLTDYLGATGNRLPGSVRLFNVGGERINPRILQDFLGRAPGVRFLNGYGPTETTITATYYEAAGKLAPGDVPIGRAADHVLAYVVAPDGSLAPRGVIGELWIGGVGVGTGYLGLPEKTATVFREDRFRGSGRVYRSGDRAAWRADGDLDFFGREDRQVKMRGFRIDLGHVERVLETAQPGLGVIAAVRDAATPAARLLAWVKPADGTDGVDLDGLRTVAEEKLPPAMRPQVVAVTEFPRTAGGKIDVAALPDPSRPETATRQATMTALEEQIAGLMAASLGGVTLGPDDDFYALGGHSLLAAELVGRLESDLGHRISVLDLRQHPTARGLARVVKRGSAAPRHITPIQPEGGRPPLFAVHILGGWHSYYTALAAELGPDQPLLGVSIGSLSDDKATGVKATARRYFEEIQEHHPEGPVHLAAVSLGAYYGWELACLLRAAGREVGSLVLFDAAGPGGRESVSGLARLGANLRTLAQRGPGAIPDAVINRWENLQHRLIARRQRHRTESGEGIEIRNGHDFIAANELAVEAYKPEPCDVPLTIFRSAENFFDTEACIADGLGWRRVATGGFRVIEVPGGHLSMLDPPHVKVLAGHISRILSGD